MKDITKILLDENNMSKEILKKKNDDIIKELNSFKSKLILNNDENRKETNESETYLESNESLFKYDDEHGYMFSKEIDSDELDIVKDVLLKDPTFALKFIERKRDMMTEYEYDTLKKSIVDKLGL